MIYTFTLFFYISQWLLYIQEANKRTLDTPTLKDRGRQKETQE